MEIKSEPIRLPQGVNVVIGQAHFIKTIDDVAEIVATSVPQAKYGVAFNEASGPCLVRAEGNDVTLKAMAIETAHALGAGHAFVLLLRDCYPINILGRLKACPEVCCIFCATDNAVEVVVAETAQGRGILGVVDGLGPDGVEGPDDIVERKRFLREIGYKP